MRVIDLSHSFGAGFGSYPGLPQPVVRDQLTFDDSQSRCEPGTESNIKLVEMVANTGTYLDTRHIAIATDTISPRSRWNAFPRYPVW